MKRFGFLSAFGALVFAASVSTASAQNYVAQPWTFVGAAGDCGTGYPAGRKIVTSTWLNGMGLPDSGAAHPSTVKSEAHSAILLSKNGPTPNCSSAGFEVIGWTPGVVHTLGFDIRNGGHCGGGAPRFHLVSGSNSYVLGCAHGQSAASPQDPANWDRVTFNAAGGPYPGDGGFIFGVTIVDEIHVIYDEGTDTATLPNNPAGIGLTVLDNIRINNTLITKKKGNVILP